MGARISWPLCGCCSHLGRCGVALHATWENCTSTPFLIEASIHPTSKTIAEITFTRSIAGRAVQGIGGSGLYSLAQVCLLEQGPSRPEVVGALVGITLSISFVLGPLLGGAISEWSWRGIFWFKLVVSFS